MVSAARQTRPAAIPTHDSPDFSTPARPRVACVAVGFW